MMEKTDGRVGRDKGEVSVEAMAFEDVSFKWPGNARPVIRDLSMSLTSGERVFVGGPSGSGKTTLLALLAGMVVPQQGNINLLGSEVNALNGAARDRFRADHIGYIHQQFNLVPYLSVEENTVLPCQFSTRRKERAQENSGSLRSEAVRLLSHLGIAEQELLRRSVSNLSVGQQQRVAAARALIGSPEILIADEPTSALDAANRESFIELLFQECEATGATLIFVSHDFSLAPMFDRSVQLDGGSVC